MKYRNVHIGELIKQKIEEKHISISQFAKAIHCSRTNVYHIFTLKSIDIDKLLLISSVLEYDFLEEYRINIPTKPSTQITLDFELKDGVITLKQIHP